ncbi:ATP-binding cassette domain-containing protein [Robbsia sp. KACC 23696]|uniref:ABC transporter ATP-binding protein n=1 Tax=Robbsia sp. KACC 23696 TaxID=3149231 RepID=UPI00325A9230
MTGAPRVLAPELSPLLRVDGLTLDATSPRADTTTRTRCVVEGVSFTIQPGERVALVGASGSGKTLTALAIAGLLPEDIAHRAGMISLANQAIGPSVHAVPARGARPSVRTDSAVLHGASHDRSRETLRTAMIFQDARAALQPIRRIGKQIDDVLRYTPRVGEVGVSRQPPNRRQRDAAARALLNEVGLPDAERVLRGYPAQLSGGMCQRVMIALALARAPELLLADEPTTGLDAAKQQRVMHLLDQATKTRNTALLLITHDLPLAVAHCDRIVVMRAGRCVEVIDAASIGDKARHRYTRTLWAAHRLSGFVSLDSAMAALDGGGKASEPETVAAVGADASGAMSALQLEAVSKSYAALFRQRTDVLRNIDLTVQPGKIIGISGPSGGGKTTLGRIVARLAQQDSGRVIWRDIDLSAVHPAAAASATWRHEVQYLHQDARASLDPLRTVGEILAGAHWPPRPRGIDARSHLDRRDSLDSRLREVGLPIALADRLPHQLSGGEAARVALARALTRKPRLLVLDEPTAALDTLSRARILRLIHRLARSHGLTVLCISHDLEALDMLCDRVLTLEAGCLRIS